MPMLPDARLFRSVWFCLALATGVAACAVDQSDAPLASDEEAAGHQGSSNRSGSTSAVSAGWPSSGHDLANSGHNPGETVLGVDNVDDLVVGWDHPGPVIGTTVVAGGTAYYADSSGAVHARLVADGTALWSAPVSDATPDSVLFSRFLSAPVVSGEWLFLGDSAATVYRLDRTTGTVDWAVDVDDHPVSLVYGDPQVVGDRLVVGISSFENTVECAGCDLTMRGSVVSLRTDDGIIDWQVWTTSDQNTEQPKFGAGVGVWSSPAIDLTSGHVFIGTGQHYEPGSEVPGSESEADPDLSDSLLRLELAGGDVTSHQFTQGDIWGATYPDGFDYDVGTPPNLFTFSTADGDVDAVGVGDKEGTYYVLDRTTMEVLWSRKISEGSVVGGFQATAAYADGILYVASHESLEGASLNDHFPPGQSISYLATEAGVGLMQTGSRTNLAALDAGTGDVIWEASVPGAITFAPLVIANGVLYHGDLNGTVRALDAATGEVLTERHIGGIELDGGRVGGNFITALSVADGHLFVSSIPLPGIGGPGLVAYTVAETG